MEKSKFASLRRILAVLLTLTLIMTVAVNTLIPASASTVPALQRINDLIATVDATAVTESDAVAINEISVLYKALLDNSPTSATELGATDKVTTADVTAYGALSETEKTELANKVTALDSSLATCVKEGYTAFTTFTTAQNWTWYQKTDNYLRIRFRDKTMHPAWRGGASPMVKFDGLELKFNRMFKNYDTYNFGSGNVSVDNAGISMLFSTTNNYDYEQASTKGFVLYLDAVRGNLVLNFNGNRFYREIIQNSDILKLANLEFNAFTVAINATTDAANPYKVTVRTASGQSVSGNIPVEKGSFDAAVLSGGNTYVTFTRGRFDSTGNYLATNYATYDVIGYRDNTGSQEKVDWLNTQLAALDVATLTEADAKTVNKLPDVYNSLIPAEKAEITDSDEIAALGTKMLELVKAGYTQYSGTSAFTTDYWGGVLTFNDGCAHFVLNQTSLSPGLRIGVKAGVSFDGLSLKFNHLMQTASDATMVGFGIVLSNSTAYATSGTFSKGLLLFLDAKSGNLILNLNGTAKYKDLIVNSDVLKLDSLQYNTFTLSFSLTDDAAYPCKVTIATSDGHSVSADIPSDCFDASAIMTSGTTYITFTRGMYLASGAAPVGAKLGSSFDVVGYANFADINKVNALIAQIPAVDNITVNNGGVANRAYVEYNKLSDDRKAMVTGASVIDPAVAAYESAFTESNAGAGYDVIKNSHFSTYLSVINGWWPGGFTASLLSNDAGTRLDWNNKGLNVRLNDVKQVNMNGLKLQFNRWLQTGGDIAEFAIFIDGTANATYPTKAANGNSLALVFNATNGTLKAATSWCRDEGKTPIYTDIITSDLLKYDSIGGGKFVVSMSKMPGGSYSVVVTVGNRSVEGTLPTSVLESVSANLPNPGKCYVTVSGWTAATQSIDYVGQITLPDVETNDVSFYGASLTLTDNVAVNYKLDPTTLTGYLDPYIEFVQGGVKHTVSDYTIDDNGLYVFRYSNVDPGKINDPIVATLYANNGTKNVSCDRTTYGVAIYCYRMLSQHPTDTNLCRLLVDILNYGAKTQLYSGYNTDNLATAGLTAAQLAMGTQTEPTLESVPNIISSKITGATASWKGAGLYLDDAINIRLTFSTTQDVSNLTARVTSATAGSWTIPSVKFSNAGTNRYSMYVTQLNAAQMRDVINVVIYNGDTPISNTLSYSVVSYAYSKQNDSDATLAELVKSIIKYGDSAANYVANAEG